MDRRNFLRGLVAAPAVILTNHLMPVRLFDPNPFVLRYKGWVQMDAGLYYAPYESRVADLMAREILSVQPLWDKPEIREAVAALSGRASAPHSLERGVDLVAETREVGVEVVLPAGLRRRL
jgi:hypothetical protein